MLHIAFCTVLLKIHIIIITLYIYMCVKESGYSNLPASLFCHAPHCLLHCSPKDTYYMCKGIGIQQLTGFPAPHCLLHCSPKDTYYNNHLVCTCVRELGYSNLPASLFCHVPHCLLHCSPEDTYYNNHLVCTCVRESEYSNLPASLFCHAPHCLLHCSPKDTYYNNHLVCVRESGYSNLLALLAFCTVLLKIHIIIITLYV